MIREIEVIEFKLKLFKEQLEELTPIANRVRSYYKYQTNEQESTSETFICNFESLEAAVLDVISDLSELKSLDDEDYNERR